MADFTLPELGENVTSGDVLRVLVNPGDTLATGQVVLELETDKATIEVPSPVDGRVAEVYVKVGDKIDVGQLVLRVNEEGTVPAGPGRRVPDGEAPGSVETGGAAPGVGEGSAAPSVRRLARELGVDIADVPGSERAVPGGLVERASVATESA